MRVNPYYNNETMNLKRLARDLEKQGFTCNLSEDGDYYKPFKERTFYRAATNWSVIKLLRKLVIDAK